jgi:hypothetical protein
MTRLGDKIRVEPLDDLTLVRVERQVLSAIDPSKIAPKRASAWSVSRRWAGAVAVAGVVLAVFLNLRSSFDGSNAAVTLPDTSPESTSLTTGDDTTRLAIDGAVIVLGPNARAELIRFPNGGTTVVLADGRVDCEVEPRNNRPPFVVEADEVKVQVVGTVFAVDRDGDDVRVEVTRGKVEVVNRTGQRPVAAGQAWTDQQDQVVALAAASVESPPSVVAAPPQPAVAAAKVTSSDAASAIASAASAGKSDTRAGAQRRTASASRTTPKKAPADAGPVTLTRPPRGTAPAELEEIRAIETRNPAEAARRYFEIAYKTGKGDIASYAMYSLAYLQMFELGQESKAIETAGHYRRRFRKGRESRAALWLSVRATCETSSDDDCRDAAGTYVARYPSGRHADQARWLKNR